MFRKLKVTSGDLRDTDVLIGMDVISMGDFAVTAKAGELDATFDVGSWSGALVNAGTYTATVTGNGNFKGEQPVTFVITPATATLVAAPKAADIYLGQTLATSALSDGSVTGLGGVPVEGEWTWADGSIAPAAEDSDTTEYEAVFTPASDNYAPVSAQVTVHVGGVGIPSGKTLTYTGVAQTGVDAGEGYELSGTVSATVVGAKPAAFFYRATIDPKAEVK